VGDGMAKLMLGQYYYYGTGPAPKNHKIARRWFEKAADSGIGKAAYSLSVMCKNREGGLRDCEQDWLDKGMELGYTPKK
jgi:TPR repeat protein